MFCLREVQIHCGEYKEAAESARKPPASESKPPKVRRKPK